MPDTSFLSPKAKLDALRALCKEQQVDGFIIPSNDEFLGEYTPASAKRLLWLTGFSGSAGIAIVLLNKAAFFTDGRYVLQAEAEVDGSLYERHNSAEYSLSDWLLNHTAAGMKIAYDPWLHTESFVLNLEKTLGRTNSIAVPSKENLIDPLWTDQPLPPISPVSLHPEIYTGESKESKIARLSEKLREERIDALLLTAPDSVCWLLNIRGKDVPYTPFCLSFAVLFKEGTVDFYCHPDKLSQEVEEALSPEVACIALEEMPLFIQALKGKRVQIDAGLAPVWFLQQLRIMHAEIIFNPDPCQIGKACKNDIELMGMRACHIRDGAAVALFLYELERQLKAGKTITELDIEEGILAKREQQELFVYPSFATIAGYGSNGAIVHYHAKKETSKEIKPGNLLLIDSGGQYLDGTTDITRTIAIGTPTATQKEHFTRVLKGHIALAMARFPEGTTGSQLDSLARYHLWQEGLDYDHGTGHGVGSYLSVHEGPQRISKMANNIALKAGMILSNEPGYYQAGEYGIRIENLVAVVSYKKGAGSKHFLQFETITKVPIDLKLVDKALLTSAEIMWLNAYHQEVFTLLEPFFKEKEALIWLKEVTRSI